MMWGWLLKKSLRESKLCEFVLLLNSFSTSYQSSNSMNTLELIVSSKTSWKTIASVELKIDENINT